MFSKLCTCLNVCATLLKLIQPVFQHTTCRIRLNLHTIFIKLILKKHNLAPIECVCYYETFTTSLKFSYNLLSIKSLAYRVIAQPIILCALYDEMAAETLCESCARWNDIICQTALSSVCCCGYTVLNSISQVRLNSSTQVSLFTVSYR